MCGAILNSVLVNDDLNVKMEGVDRLESHKHNIDVAFILQSLNVLVLILLEFRVAVKASVFDSLHRPTWPGYLVSTASSDNWMLGTPLIDNAK